MQSVVNTVVSWYTVPRQLVRIGTRWIMNERIEDKWIVLEEAAEYMDVTKDTVRNWIKKTDIPAHKIGKLWKFKKSEIDEWIKSGKSALPN